MNQPTQLLFTLDRNLSLPANGVVTFSAVRDANGKVSDLWLTSFHVQNGPHSPGLPDQTSGLTMSGLLRELHPDEEAALLFRQCVEVVETRRQISLRQGFHTPAGIRFFEWSVFPQGDGLLILYNETPAAGRPPTLTPSGDGLLRRLLDTATCGLVFSRPLRDSENRIVDFQVEECNEAICRMTGFPRHRMLTETMLTCDPLGLENGIFERWAGVIRTGQEQELDHFFEGAGRWLRQKLTPWDGGILASFEDISDERRSRQADLLEQVFNNVYTGIVVYEAVRRPTTDQEPGPIVDFYIRHINETAARMRGLPADRIVGRLASELFPEQKSKGLFHPFVQVCETGKPIRTQKHYADFGVWVDVCITRQDDGLVVTFSDITAQRKASEELQRQTRLLQTIVDQTQAGISLMEPVYDEAGDVTDFRIVLVNQYTARTFGRSVKELTDGRPLGEIMVGWQETERFGIHRQVLATGEPHTAVLYHDNFGFRGWFEVSIDRVGNRLLHTLVDITAIRQAEEDQRKQSELLQTVVDNLKAGLLLLDAVRSPGPNGEPGPIVDFRYRLTNEYNASLGRKTALELTGRLVAEAFPGWQETELFRRMVEVVETGRPQTNVAPYGEYGWDGWFDGSYIKIGDGLLYTYVDVTALKESEIDARRKQELLDSILNASPTAIMACEAVPGPDGSLPDYRYVAVNAVAAGLFGRPQGEIVGRTLKELFPNAGQADFLEYWQRAYETGEPQQFETHYPFDGYDAWYEMSVVRWGDGLVVVGSDITQTRKAQQEKQYQAETFNAVLSSMLHGMAIFRLERDERGEVIDLRYEYVSEQVLHDTGLSRGQVIGESVLRLFPGLPNSGFWPAYRMVLEAGAPQQFEDHYIWDGVDNYILGQVVRIDENRIVMTYQILNELKKAQKQSEEQTRLLRSVLDGSQNGIIAFDAVRNDQGAVVDFRYILQNEANRQRVSRTDEQVIGRTMMEFFPDVRDNGLFDRYVEVVETGKPFRADIEYNYGTGLGWFNLSVVKRGDGIVLTVMDKTAEKRAEENQRTYQRRLEAANEQLMESNENLQSFAYVASHDLQEPLRKIQAFGDVLVTRYQSNLPQEAQDLVRRMQVASARMSDLIRDILAYSRISTHGKPFEPVPLGRLVEEIRTDLAHRIATADARLEVGPLPEVDGDRSQLWQLFSNLLSNALKFNRPGHPPVVVVRAVRLTPDQAPGPLKSRNVPGWWEIGVRDNGIGFDEKYLERIFQLFQRLHGKNQYPGSGIGLAICKKVAERHGGWLTAGSKPGEGAHFRVYLPARN
ncbi:PAS domain-containing protein [Larkinella soli]|uniref:PAS domain-containing protein n=1 Tax=Larkinella soli TaxID=1770527 RepID=UPI000FFC6251|nr:PAS domain-containing protein [Larkinella soli]